MIHRLSSSDIFNIKFGHQRNFFYLLPLYFLIFFYGFKTLLGKPWLFRIFSACYLAILFIVGIYYSGGWKIPNARREMIIRAENIKSEFVVIELDIDWDSYALNYYAIKSGIKDKTIYIDKSKPEQIPGLLSRIPVGRDFIYVKRIKNKFRPTPNNYYAADYSFWIKKYEICTVNSGVFSFLHRKLNMPDASIVIYYCQK